MKPAHLCYLFISVLARGAETTRSLLSHMMRVLLFLCVALLVVSCWSSPVGDRSSLELFRQRREPQFVKGQKGNRAPNPTNLLKGEYICGNKICSLRPGQIPANCNGDCQYKVNK